MYWFFVILLLNLFNLQTTYVFYLLSHSNGDFSDTSFVINMFWINIFILLKLFFFPVLVLLTKKYFSESLYKKFVLFIWTLLVFAILVNTVSIIHYINSVINI